MLQTQKQLHWLVRGVPFIHFQIPFHFHYRLVGVLKSLNVLVIGNKRRARLEAKIAQLGERMTEDHKVRCSIHLLGAFFFSLGDSALNGTPMNVVGMGSCLYFNK